MTSFRLALLLSGSLLVPTTLVACSSDDPAPAPSNQGGQTSGGQGGQTSGGQTSGGQGGQTSGGQGGSTSGASGQGGSAAGSTGEGGQTAAGSAGMTAAGAGGASAGAGGGSKPEPTPIPPDAKSCADLKATDCFVSAECTATERCETFGPPKESFFCCVPGPRGAGKVGDACKDQFDCASGVCINDVQCSDVCEKTEDCPAGMKCSGIGLCIPME